MGLIVRTAGVGRNVEELQWDLDYLLQLWESIDKATERRSAPFLIYQESNVIIRALRDYFRNDINEVLIDSPEVYETRNSLSSRSCPTVSARSSCTRIRFRLFNRFQIETQIESAFQREVRPAFRRRHRHRSHRSAGLHRHQLGPRHQGW